MVLSAVRPESGEMYNQSFEQKQRTKFSPKNVPIEEQKHYFTHRKAKFVGSLKRKLCLSVFMDTCVYRERNCEAFPAHKNAF